MFVDGCFWHGCPTHFMRPKTNVGYWGQKIQGNKDRDTDTNRKLADAGWEVVRAWEHEDPIEVVNRIEIAVRRSARGRPG